MLNVLEDTQEGKAEPTFSDRELKVARDFLLKKIARSTATAQPFAEVVSIDAKMALTLLEMNEDNRLLSNDKVAEYATDMAAGRWQGLNGQTIVVARDGFLNDGQHRLSAIIECDGAIPFMVVFGVERDSRLTLDQNKVRTTGDYLGMNRVANSKKVAAIASIIYAVEGGRIRKGYGTVMHSERRPTKSFLLKFATDRQEGILECLRAVDKTAARKLTQDTRLGAALYLIAQKVPFEEANAFMQKVIAGENMGKSNPACQVRERLLDDRVTGIVPSTLRTLEIILRGWNRYVTNDRRKFSLRGELPEIEA